MPGMTHDEWLAAPDPVGVVGAADAPEIAVPVEKVETPETPVVAATETPSTPSEAASQAAAAGATATEQVEAAQKFMEAQLADGKPFQIPEGVKIPLVRNGETTWQTIEEARKEAMIGRDYTIKRQEDSARMRQLELDRRLDSARVQAKEQFLEEQMKTAALARTSPEEAMKYEQYQEMYRNVPWFKAQVDAAAQGKVLQAERAVYQEVAEEQAMQAEATRLMDDVRSVAVDLGIDPTRLGAAYSTALQLNEAGLGRQEIVRIAQAEAQYAKGVLSPIEARVVALEAENKGFKDAAAAAAKNAQTAEGIRRSVSPVGKPASGAPSPEAAAKLTKTDFLGRSAEWARS